jgi:hemolysin III
MHRKLNEDINNFTIAEEIYNVITHGLGLILSIAGLVVLVTYSTISGSLISILSSVLYGITLILLYGSSTLYHAISHPRIKKWCQLCDHSSIYLLIAGSYTHITLIALGGILGWSIFLINWSAALFGIYMKFKYQGQYEKLSLFLYLIMGWLILIAIQPLMEVMQSEGLWLLLFGGLAYTFGVIFYVKDNKPYYHAIWHLFVLAGSTFHFFMVLLYII